jgi:tetratricopeptide (TPR) repeat protein
MAPIVRDALNVLALLTILLALLVVVGILVSIVRSIWRVTFGRATLILPFTGGDRALLVHSVLAEQLGRIEAEWKTLSAQIRDEEGLRTDDLALLDLGPVRVLGSGETLESDRLELVTEEPIDGQAIPPLSFAGVTVAPDSLFNLLYRVRASVARRMVRGNVADFGNTVRLSAEFLHTAKASPEAEGIPSRKARRRVERELLVVVRELAEPGQFLDVIDDIAFQITKHRLAFTSEGERWCAYHAFLQGYYQHLLFLRTGQVLFRERAVERYQAAIDHEPDYRYAHYNLGALLYNRYTEDTNASAIDHFTVAADATDPELRALALSGLTLAYAQNVHRYGLGSDPWSLLADQTSAEALEIDPNLEETNLARGWAYQLNGRIKDAIASYERTVELDGDTPAERQVKSFAQNNNAYIHMTELDDLTGAEQLLHDALDRYPNKMAFANLGEIHTRQHQYELALDDYRSALRLDPKYANAMNEMALVYLAQARTAAPEAAARLIQQADDCHTRALALVPASAANQLETLKCTYDVRRRAIEGES